MAIWDFKDKAGRYAAELEKVVSYSANLWSTTQHFPHFTVHGIDHSESIKRSLRDWLEKSLGKDGDFLTDRERFFLLAAIYLHDIGMQCHDVDLLAEHGIVYDRTLPTQEVLGQIRKNHALLSQSMIRKAVHDGFLPLLSAYSYECIGTICRRHSGNSAIADDLRPVGGEDVRLDLLSALLRIGDAMDCGQDRINADFYSNPRQWASVDDVNRMHTLLNWSVLDCRVNQSVFTISLFFYQGLSEGEREYFKKYLVSSLRGTFASAEAVLRKNNIPSLEVEFNQNVRYSMENCFPLTAGVIEILDEELRKGKSDPSWSECMRLPASAFGGRLSQDAQKAMAMGESAEADGDFEKAVGHFKAVVSMISGAHDQDRPSMVADVQKRIAMNQALQALKVKGYTGEADVRQIKVFDERGVQVGHEPKERVHAERLLHHTVILIVRWPDNRVLYYKRHPKQAHPGRLDFFGGHTNVSDATSFDTAFREANEELHLFAGTFRIPIDRAWICKIGDDFQFKVDSPRNNEWSTLYMVSLPAHPSLRIRIADESGDGKTVVSSTDFKLASLRELAEMYAADAGGFADGAGRILNGYHANGKLRAELDRWFGIDDLTGETADAGACMAEIRNNAVVRGVFARQCAERYRREDHLNGLKPIIDAYIDLYFDNATRGFAIDMVKTFISALGDHPIADKTHHDILLLLEKGFPVNPPHLASLSKIDTAALAEPGYAILLLAIRITEEDTEGSYNRALEFLENNRSRVSNPGTCGLYNYIRGQCYRKSERLDDAIGSLGNAERILRGEGAEHCRHRPCLHENLQLEIVRGLGAAYRKRHHDGDAVRAVECFERGSALADRSATIDRKVKADFYYSYGYFNLDRAWKCRVAASMGRDDDGAAGKLALARDNFEKAIAIRPEWCAPKSRLGIVKLLQGERSDAKENFHAAAELGQNEVGTEPALTYVLCRFAALFLSDVDEAAQSEELKRRTNDILRRNPPISALQCHALDMQMVRCYEAILDRSLKDVYNIMQRSANFLDALLD